MIVALAVSNTVASVIGVAVAFGIGVIGGVIAGASTVNALELRIALLRRALLAIANRDAGQAGDRALDALAVDQELAADNGTKAPDDERAV